MKNFTLKFNLLDDAELRKEFKALIKDNIKAVTRKEIRAIVFENVGDEVKSYTNETLLAMIKAEIKEQVHKYLTKWNKGNTIIERECNAIIKEVVRENIINKK